MPHSAENGSSISACFSLHVAVQSFPYLFFFSNQLADDVNTCVDAAQPAPYLKIEGPLHPDILQCTVDSYNVRSLRWTSACSHF
jgi:hypothetical protein